MRISDKELSRLIDSVKKRQSDNMNTQDANYKRMPFLVRMRDFRATRALERHNDALKQWYQINNLIAKRRNYKSQGLRSEPLTLKSDGFRKKVEVLETFEHQQTNEEKYGKFAWTLSLRSSKSHVNPKAVKPATVYGANSMKTQYFPNRTRFNNLNMSSSFNMSMKDTLIGGRKFENGDTDETYSSQCGSEFYYLEPTGNRPDGVWVQKKSHGLLPQSLEIIRKSQYDFSKTTDLRESKPVNPYEVSEKLVEGYKHKLESISKKRNSLNHIRLTREGSSEGLVKIKTDKLSKLKNDSQLLGLELVGKNKLEAEIEACYMITGPKVYVRNHYFTELGEGEPDNPEEIIEE